MAESGKPKAGIGYLDKQAEELSANITNIRLKISQNDSALGKKISEKIKTESKLNALLKARFSREKSRLSNIKSGSARKQASLKRKIAALEKINQVYNEKKSRISEAKKKQLVLKKQLELLEKQAGEWQHV